MNYLQLVQAVHRESGSGGTAPSSLTDLRGENLRLMNWVQQADLLIQEEFVDWQFRWATGSIPLTAGTALYLPGDDIAEFDRGTFRIDGETIGAVNYLDVKKFERDTQEGIPYQMVIMPDGTLRADLTPDSSYNFTFDYWTKPVALAGAADVSLIPERFHLVIVGRALMMYAEYENAPEIMQKGTTMYGEWLDKLQSSQLPGNRFMHNKAEDNDMMITVE